MLVPLAELPEVSVHLGPKPKGSAGRNQDLLIVLL